MDKTKYTKIGYTNKSNGTTVKCLTGEILEQLMKSEAVEEIMLKIENESDTEKKRTLKGQLPAVFFQCEMPEDGCRPRVSTSVPSGLCMHDWDHLDVDPFVWYMQNIAGREDELGIVFAHVTPSGNGIRLVTTMHDGELLSDCQVRIAAMFGMVPDPKVKDIVHMSFLPWQKYLLYINKVGLFEKKRSEAEKGVQPHGFSKLPLTKRPGPVVSDSPNFCDVSKQGEVGMPSIADSFTYEGIKYSAIIQALLQRIATQGEPREGERNDDLFALVRELRHVCEYNFQKVYMLVAPYFSTLPDAEIRRTISSAIATTGRTITPVMKGVLDELRNQNVEPVSDSDDMKEQKLPKVSEVEEMILSKFPKHMRNHVFKAMLPIWGVYGTHVRFNFMDGRVNSLSFMTAVVGKSGSGKAFASHLFDQMTKRFRDEDALERQKADKYLDDCTKAADNKQKPDDPRPRVRLYSDDITTSQLFDYLQNLNGEHGLQFTEEIIRLQKAKRSVWGDNDDLYCKSFDNGIGGKESKSKLTRNIRIPIYLNTLFCGTPGAMHKFYDNPEGGLNNRVVFSLLPNIRIKGFIEYGEFTAEEQKLFDDISERLWQSGMDGNKLKLPWLEKIITSIKNKWDKDDEENPNEVWYDLGKRSLVVAMRVGVLQWLLRGCPDDVKSYREIGKVVRWMADSMRQGIYLFSGKDYEKIAEHDNECQRQTTCYVSKNKRLFTLLGDEFTTQDVIALRVRNGDSPNVYMVLSRWMQAGLITSEAKGHYRKRKVQVA